MLIDLFYIFLACGKVNCTKELIHRNLLSSVIYITIPMSLSPTKGVLESRYERIQISPSWFGLKPTSPCGTWDSMYPPISQMGQWLSIRVWGLG